MNTIKEPLVSVIVPVYNVETYIDACLYSIKQQTYKNLEIIVVEDCSTDHSRELLDSHLVDERIKVIQHEKNSGLSAARNTGIDFATGEYMMFVDSDDIVDTRLVEACVDCAIQKSAEVVSYGFVPFEDGLAEVKLPYPSDSDILDVEPVLGDNSYFTLPHFAWLKFIRSDLVRSASLHFPVGLYYEDWPFHWHLGLVTKARYQIPVNLYLYRQRGSSITGSTGKELLDLFVIHSKVNSLLQEFENDEIKKIFTDKVRQSHWSILTRIESKYLIMALTEAQKAEKNLQLNDYSGPLNLRTILISKVVSMPYHAALYSLKILRKALYEKSRFRKSKVIVN